jgi:hypothetical protein
MNGSLGLLASLYSPTPAAQAFHSNFQTVSSISPGALDLPPDMVQGHRFQALDLLAGQALEMGMGRVMLTGQFIESRDPLGRQLADQPQAGETVQDAINGYFVYRAPDPNGVENLPGLPGAVLGTQGFQNPETKRSGPDAAPNQGLMKVTTIAHMP